MMHDQKTLSHRHLCTSQKLQFQAQVPTKLHTLLSRSPTDTVYIIQ